MRRLTIALMVASFISPLYAQQRGRGGFVRMGVEAETVKGAPYSADVVNESVQVLADGNRIVRRSTSHVYRDSEGRVRREEDRGAPTPAITITDPVAGTSWVLDVENHTARQMPGFGRVFTLTTAGRDDMERLEVVLNGLQTAIRAGSDGRGWNVTPTGFADQPPTEEKLAPRTIEGLRVDGVRRTSTIAPGSIGNERAIVVTTEEWTSPELKALVLSEFSDPRTGTSTYKLVNVRRGEPPSSLFQVPADYAVVQGPGVGLGRGEGRGQRGGR